LSFVLLPAGLMVLPKGEPKDKGDQSAAMTLHFSRFAERHGNLVLIIALLAAAVSIFGITRLEVENRFIDYFHEDSEIHQGMKVIDQQLGGTVTLDIILDADQSLLAQNEEPLEDDPFADVDADPYGDAYDEDPFGNDEDPFADPANASSSTQESYWFSLNGLDEIAKLHSYLESLPEVGKVQSLAVS